MELVRNYKASYTTKVVRENETITRDLFSCIAFDNIGQSPIKVNGIILGSGKSVQFNEDPNVIINTDFFVEFTPDTPGQTQLVNVVITFYKEH